MCDIKAGKHRRKCYNEKEARYHKVSNDNFFGILGGMGTLASESFIRLINRKANAKSDQEYFDYVLINHASIPDRTEYLLGRAEDNPLNYLLRDIQRFNILKCSFLVIPCNTAHAFYERLQKESICEILHMPKITVNEIVDRNQAGKKIGFLGTEGSIYSGVYEKLVKETGNQIYYPNPSLQLKINALIYDDVKRKSTLNVSKLYGIIEDMRKDGNLELVVLGCTELSWIYESGSLIKMDKGILDSQLLVVEEVIRRLKK